jgi:hypothetical protein
MQECGLHFHAVGSRPCGMSVCLSETPVVDRLTSSDSTCFSVRGFNQVNSLLNLGSFGRIALLGRNPAISGLRLRLDFGFARQNRGVLSLTVRQLYGELVNTGVGFVFAISCFPPTSGPGSSVWMDGPSDHGINRPECSYARRGPVGHQTQSGRCDTWCVPPAQ